jgi:integrase
MLVKLTAGFCRTATAEPGKERTVYWDESLRGFGLVVTANGARSYCVQYKLFGRSRRRSFDAILPLDKARTHAKVLLGDVARDIDPLAERRKKALAGKNTLAAVVDEFFAREGKGLRSAAHRRAAFDRLIIPRLGSRPIAEITRSEIIRLMDFIDEDRGPSMASEALKILRRLFSWHATRDDTFRSPIVRGMTRTSMNGGRARILSDDELRAVWRAAEGRNDAFAYLVRFLLLTAARRNEAAHMKRSEIHGTDWVIPAARYKTKVEHLVPLSGKARELLGAMPMLGEWIFTADGKRAFSGFSYGKIELDKVTGVTDWRLHDLRRTARSLMSRAGVAPDIAERCLGHAMGAIRGVYDRYSYREEKRHAFEALAAQIERIVDPQQNVHALRG